MSPPPDLPRRRRLKKLGVRISARIAPVLYRTYMRLVVATSRVTAEPVARIIEESAAGRTVALTLLHQDLFALPFFFRGCERLVAIANVGDAGELIAATLEGCGLTVARGGSSSRASRRAPVVRDLIRTAVAQRGDRRMIMAITPDGSRGPAGAVKGGVALFATKTGARVYCVHVHASRAFYLNTWDRTMVPLPFGTISIRAGEPIDPPRAAAGRAALEALRTRIEDTLHGLHRDAFREAGRDPVPSLSRLAATERPGWDQAGRSRTVPASGRDLP